MSTVHLYTGPREWYRPVIVERDEIYCSPWLTTAPDGIKTFWRNQGPYNVPALLASFPPPFNKPSLVTVMLDCDAPALGLEKVDCPKVLFVGDTHHGIRPIERRVKAALAAPWDLVVLEFRASHCHWFTEAGVKNVASIPCFNINPHNHAPTAHRTRGVTFCGQVGPRHPRRTWMLKELMVRGIPIEIHQGTQEQVAQIYNESAVSLNIALNGDFNLRNFEIPAAGGTLFTEDRVWGGFATRRVDEIAWMLRRVAKDAEAGIQGARVDYLHFWGTHGPDQQSQRLRNTIVKPPTPFDDGIDHSRGTDIWRRITDYEEIQERHRLHAAEEPLVIEIPEPIAALDASDLPYLVNPLFRELRMFDPPELSQLSCPPCS